MKHWIAVVSRDHAQIAARSGFLQVNHGKAAPLRRTSTGDEVFIYCPRSGMRAGEVLKRVEFRCVKVAEAGRIPRVIENDTVYQVEQAPGFKPFRKDVRFDTGFQGISIGDVQGMELTANPHWGMLARRGFFEISAARRGVAPRVAEGAGVMRASTGRKSCERGEVTTPLKAAGYTAPTGSERAFAISGHVFTACNPSR